MSQRIVTARIDRVVSVAGETLFAIAARELGDATQWDRIARLNGLVDPFIDEGVEIRLPPVDATAGNGGILNG